MPSSAENRQFAPCPSLDCASTVAVKTTDSVCAFREELFRFRQTGSLRVQMGRKVMAGWKEKMEQKVGTLETEVRQLRQENDWLRAQINQINQRAYKQDRRQRWTR
ncbi:hypothetical protein NW755_012622 [Fusarium falciforme]|uniref:Uncharacterized protein n=1 Tax=Fusarium falciforme TaxID=195108 RepID=A0A9W8QUA5_9HYPO|nr:hypothetical protein NW755_012622 [Fusarium falciforme]